jgi:ribosomal protein S18 acetylase RimI-like enzyme
MVRFFMSIPIRALRSGDIEPLHDLLRRVAVFEPHEIGVAEELLSEALSGSPDYLVSVAEDTTTKRILGYVCHGHNPVTDALHDLYWIAVEPSAQRAGLGRALLAHTEDRVRESHGRGIAIETSGRAEYAAARRLYERCGYGKVAEIADFYKPGDSMLMYLKFL